MKKILSCFLALAAVLSISTTVIAAEPTESNVSGEHYMDYDLSELVGDYGVMPIATSKTEKNAGTVSATLFNGATGNISGESAPFKFTGIPKDAIIKDIHAWNPSKSNVTQNRFIAIENIQVIHNGDYSDLFKFWITPEPSLRYPCNTSFFNGREADATYAIKIHGRMITNESGFDGFTVRGTRVRVTYTF